MLNARSSVSWWRKLRLRVAGGAAGDASVGGGEGGGAVDIPPTAPYAAALLTRLLTDCLDGGCVTSLLVVVSPAEADFDVTYAVLCWATTLLPLRSQGVEGRGDITLNLAKQVQYVQVGTFRFPGEQQSVATAQAARGNARPPCRHLKIQSVAAALGLLSRWRLSKPSTFCVS
jgi:hypothetical protein